MGRTECCVAILSLFCTIFLCGMEQEYNNLIGTLNQSAPSETQDTIDDDYNWDNELQNTKQNIALSLQQGVSLNFCDHLKLDDGSLKAISPDHQYVYLAGKYCAVRDQFADSRLIHKSDVTRNVCFSNDDFDFVQNGHQFSPDNRQLMFRGGAFNHIIVWYDLKKNISNLISFNSAATIHDLCFIKKNKIGLLAKGAFYLLRYNDLNSLTRAVEIEGTSPKCCRFAKKILFYNIREPFLWQPRNGDRIAVDEVPHNIGGQNKQVVCRGKRLACIDHYTRHDIIIYQLKIINETNRAHFEAMMQFRHSHPVTSCTFDTTGKFIMSGTDQYEGCIRLWSIDDATCLATLTGISHSPITRLSWSQDQSSILARNGHGSVFEINIDPKLLQLYTTLTKLLSKKHHALNNSNTNMDANS